MGANRGEIQKLEKPGSFPKTDKTMAIYGSTVDFAALRIKIRQNILFGANGRRSSVYTSKWPETTTTLPKSSIGGLDNSEPPDGIAPPAYTSAVTEQPKEVPKRLSVTPSEMTLEEAKAPTPSTETPPLVLDNNTVEKRRISEDYKKESPTIERLIRSPVVEDTLSDIEEALSEIRTTPRSTGAHVQKNKQQPPIMEAPEEPHGQGNADFDDSASDYSRSAFGNESSLSLVHGGNHGQYLQSQNPYARESSEFRGSDNPYSPQFVAQSSSEDEDEGYSLEQVRGWTPAQVSAYFQEQHMPLTVCDKFEEQEISGSILLQLEMAHLKELEISSFGKRFEVWQEIEKLKAMVGLPTSGANPLGEGGDKGKQPRNRSSSTPGGVLPRLPSLHNRPPAKKGSLDVPQTHQEEEDGAIRESPTTMSPASVGPPPPRSDASGDNKSVSTSSIDRASSVGGPPIRAHGRDPSFDRNWTLKNHKQSDSAATGRSRFTGDSGFASQTSSILANERNYISGDDAKRERNVLHKRGASSGNHSKKSSYTDETRTRAGNTSLSTHPETPTPEGLHNSESDRGAHSTTVSPGLGAPSPASIAYHNSVKGRKRSTSDAQQANLDPRQSMAPSPIPGGKTLSVERPLGEDDDEEAVSEERRIPPAIRTGPAPQRSVSDGAEKAMAMSPLSQDTSSTLLSPSEPSPSIKIIAEGPERKSDDLKDRNGKDKDKKLRSVSSASGIRQKSKKQLTSAYQEGLKEISPVAAAAEADFSGWMKKRGSSAVVTSWKSRFFVLKGRRLSYFYSMEDKKERGLIDITSHRVLPAAEDKLVSLHASVAAITTSIPTGQQSSAIPGHGSSVSSLPPTPSGGKGSWFVFKLVPPAPGAAKGVMFTPPKLHYFATDTKQIGRQWMAAFMKATIDRDVSAPVVSTFSAETISLAKARAMRTRPPGFGPETPVTSKPSPIIGLPIMSSQGSFNDSIESALAARSLAEDDVANAADDER